MEETGGDADNYMPFCGYEGGYGGGKGSGAGEQDEEIPMSVVGQEGDSGDEFRQNHPADYFALDYWV